MFISEFLLYLLAWSVHQGAVWTYKAMFRRNMQSHDLCTGKFRELRVTLACQHSTHSCWHVSVLNEGQKTMDLLLLMPPLLLRRTELALTVSAPRLIGWWPCKGMVFYKILFAKGSAVCHPHWTAHSRPVCLNHSTTQSMEGSFSTKKFSRALDTKCSKEHWSCWKVHWKCWEDWRYHRWGHGWWQERALFCQSVPKIFILTI